MEPPRLKAKGAKWWRTADYHAPRLSKSALGEFMFSVIRCGAHIGEIWPFQPDYKGSPVYFMIFMTDEQKTTIEAETKARFAPPENVHLNSPPTQEQEG